MKICQPFSGRYNDLVLTIKFNDMKQLPIFRTSLTTGLCWGIIGGLAMVLMQKLSHNGLLGILPYFLFLIISVLTVRLTDSDNKYRKIFFTALLTFMIMSLALYVYILFVLNPSIQEMSLSGHLWRLGAMLGIGAISSGLLTFLVTRKL